MKYTRAKKFSTSNNKALNLVVKFNISKQVTIKYEMHEDLYTIKLITFHMEKEHTQNMKMEIKITPKKSPGRI